VIGSRRRTAAAERVHRRFELEEVLIRGRLALVGINQLTGGLDEPGDALVAADRILLGHDTSMQIRELHRQWYPISAQPRWLTPKRSPTSTSTSSLAGHEAKSAGEVGGVAIEPVQQPID
jgi:hypothetical protein